MTQINRRLGVCAATLLLGLSGSAMAESPFQTEGLILSSDMLSRTGYVRIFDPINGTVVFDYRVSDYLPESCAGENAVCTPMGVSHVVHDNKDYIDMAVWVRNGGGEGVLSTFVQRVSVSDPADVVWRIESMDFTQSPTGESYCKQRSTAPGKGMNLNKPTLKNPTSYCAFDWIHSIQIIDDNPDEKTVTVLVAEGYQTAKYLQMTLNYADDNRRAVVDWVFGMNDESYPWLMLGDAHQYAQPNSVRVYDEPGGPYLLASYYGVDVSPVRSLIAMYRWDAEVDNWALSWRFPEAIDGVKANLNIVHMAEYQVDESTGERWITYNHSSSTSPNWGEGTENTQGGSWGALKVGELLSDKPTYLFDVLTFAETNDDRSHYPRDFDILPDGTWLLSDSSCENQSQCDKESRFFRTLPLNQPAVTTDKLGYYVPESKGPRAQMTELNLVTIPEDKILDVYQCGIQITFEGEWLAWSDLGRDLKNSAATTTTRCR